MKTVFLRCLFGLTAVAMAVSILVTPMASNADAPAPNADAPALPVEAAPANTMIRYVGRFAAAANGLGCDWPASTVELSVMASAVNLKLGESGDGDEYEIFVDGVPTNILTPSAGDHVYRIFSSEAPAKHSVEIVKRTEAFAGTGTFEGFQLSEKGRLLKQVAPRHELEIIGDSISCGYGDEGASQNEHFTNGTEDAAFAYGPVAARALDADCFDIAWSGKTMWPTNTMPELYGRTIATDQNSVWDYSAWIPDVIVINLSTNDFRNGPPDEVSWTEGYETFIRRIRGYYPKAVIYCAMSPMLGGASSDTLGTYLNKIISDETAAGDSNVKLMPIKTQDTSLGLGADWHPNIANQQRAAATLVTQISQDEGWKIVPDPSSTETLASLKALPIISLSANNGN